MRNMSKIGVLMPTHKRPDLIKRAVESLRNQTEQDFDLVVICNGMMNDEVAKYDWSILPGVGRNQLAINFPHFSNVAQALQFGLPHINVITEYVAVLEDDDEWKPEFLEKMSQALDERPEIAMAYCDELELSPDGIEVDWTGHEPVFTREALLKGNWIHFPVQMWRYGVLVNQGGFSVETSGAADWDTALRMSMYGVYHLREVLAVHHWLSDRFDDSPLNNCLDPAKMRDANKWVEARRELGVYS
jgi:glycosyltransferase involved in cell wall biosynthesis